MITLEQVELLKKRANVSYEDAKAALEAAEGDLLDAVIYLEQQGKVAAPTGGSYSTAPDAGLEHEEGFGQENASFCDQPNGTYPVCCNSTKSGHGQKNSQDDPFSREMKSLWRSFCQLVHKGNINHFEVDRHDSCVMSVPVNLLILALVFLFWITLPALVVGLFFNCRYHFRGPDLDRETLNNIMDNAADTAENLKKAVQSEEQQ